MEDLGQALAMNTKFAQERDLVPLRKVQAEVMVKEWAREGRRRVGCVTATATSIRYVASASHPCLALTGQRLQDYRRCPVHLQRT